MGSKERGGVLGFRRDGKSADRPWEQRDPATQQTYEFTRLRGWG